jgi:hypothetical protein
MSPPSSIAHYRIAGKQRFRLRDILHYNLKTVRALLEEEFQQLWGRLWPARDLTGFLRAGSTCRSKSSQMLGQESLHRCIPSSRSGQRRTADSGQLLYHSGIVFAARLHHQDRNIDGSEQGNVIGAVA